jgi:hypothetical protein
MIDLAGEVIGYALDILRRGRRTTNRKPFECPVRVP